MQIVGFDGDNEEMLRMYFEILLLNIREMTTWRAKTEP